ncbi:hypothetical protein [Agathobacter sp.]
MKKRISLIMVTVFAIGILSACGHTNKKENDTSVSQVTETESIGAELVTTEPEGEITISELINQRIEEDDEIFFYTLGTSSRIPIVIACDSEVNIYSYNGKVLKSYYNMSDPNRETILDDIVNDEVDFSNYYISEWGHSWEKGDEKYTDEEHHAQLEITTDDTGEKAIMETIYSHSIGTEYTRSSEDGTWIENTREKNYSVLSFGTFERIKLDGKTYMTFCVKNDLNLIEYVIIPDNEFTKDKTIVYDTPGTEGISVNTIDYLKDYQAVAKEELEQLIVPSDSKKEESSQTEK